MSKREQFDGSRIKVGKTYMLTLRGRGDGIVKVTNSTSYLVPDHCVAKDDATDTSGRVVVVIFDAQVISGIFHVYAPPFVDRRGGDKVCFTLWNVEGIKAIKPK